MSFINTVDTVIKNTLEHIITHPFLEQLSYGVLPKEVYHYYLVQDHHYLLSYSQCLRSLSTMAIQKDESIFLNEAALSCEHEPAFEIQSLIAAKTKQTKACNQYTQFLRDNIKQGYISGLSAVFPCFYIYHLVAKIKFPKDNNNPYLNWFQTYTSELFTLQTKKITTILATHYQDASINMQQNILDNISQGTKYEWHFWNDAFHFTS